MKIWKIIFLHLAWWLVYNCYLAQPAQAQSQDMNYTFTTQLTAVGQTEAFSTIPDPQTGMSFTLPRVHTVQAFITGTPTVCSFQLFGTAKRLSQSPAAADYVALGTAIDCTTSHIAFVVDQPVETVLVKLTAFTGGTRITFRYLGKR